MTEHEVLERLKAVFLDGVIYTERYSPRNLGVVLTQEVRRLSRASGQSSVQWLTAKGFTWKETGYVEPDMLPREGEIPEAPEDAFALADGVFRRYPLAGEYVLSDEEERLLYLSASQTVQKVLQGERITLREDVVLTLETVELLKGWSTDLPEAEEPISFWDYIFLQYGFQSGHSEQARNHLYDHFRRAVRRTLERYGRFFAPEGTMRYYTTLLLHALAPQRSIEGLFNILFSFYVKNLDFQYVPEDTSYKQFTKGMRARWDSGVAVQDDLQLRSDAVFSGLQTLFSQRPGYMAVLCDSLVEKMDALLRGAEQGLLDPEHNGWDRLLTRWYQKKSSVERSRVQGERREKQSEFIATTRERIFVRYALENGVVGLRLPCIRLPETGQRRPVLEVLQNGHAICQEELHVTGNDLCLTTRSRFLPLRETDCRFDEAPRLRAKITYAGDVLYDSGQKLERDYLLFDAAGNDRAVKGGRAFLFAGEGAGVEFSEDLDVLRLTHPGQLYRLELGDASAAVVDGREVFAGEAVAAQFRRHTVPGCLRGIRGQDQGSELALFQGPFTLFLVLPEGENPMQYQLSLDGEHRALRDFQGEDGALAIPSTSGEGRPHSVRLVDIRNGLVRFEYHYAILTGCGCRLDRAFYRAGVDKIDVLFSWDGRETPVTLPASEEEDTVNFTVPELDFALALDVPTLHCTLLGKNAFRAPEALWHRDIPAGEFVTVRPPEGWTCRLTLGSREVLAPDGVHYELGNELRSGRSFQKTEPLWLTLFRGQEREKLKLTEIVFAAQFIQPPLELAEDRLLWRGAESFIGDPGGRFTVELDLPDGPRAFQTGLEDCALDEAFAAPDGRYSYRVLQESGNVFAPGPASVLYKGGLLVGDPYAVLFQDREIHVQDALCWDFEQETLKRVQMRAGCGIINDIVYQGTDTPKWAPAPMPHYTATLFYEDKCGRRRPFNATPDQRFEQVNPVHIWLVSNRLLELRCVTSDGVYIDNRFATIVNKSLGRTISKEAQRRILDIPDYFEYIVKETQAHV